MFCRTSEQMYEPTYKAHNFKKRNIVNYCWLLCKSVMLYSSLYTIPIPWGRYVSLRCISQEGHGGLFVSAVLSELQQSLHAAGVLLYVHGGSVSGAGQVVQNFILSFQLCLCLQGKVLQLHQHLQTHIQLNTYTHSFFSEYLCSSPQWATEDWDLNRLNTGTNRKLVSSFAGWTIWYGPYVERCIDGVQESESKCVHETEKRGVHEREIFT